MSLWTRDRTQELRRIYGSKTDAEVAIAMRVPIAEVRSAAARLHLGKNKRRFPGTRKMPRWTRNDLQALEELYPHLPTIELAQRLGRSEKSVACKASQLGLRKSMPLLQEMGRVNVKLRKDRQPAP